ncbi:unnamed protein product [Urochloa humidicola]
MPSDPMSTASMCTMESDSRTNTIEIAGYNLKKSTSVSSFCFFRSETFSVGGFDWSIRFYPCGTTETSKDYVVALLELMSSNTEAQASYVLRFVNQAPQMLQVPGLLGRIEMAAAPAEGTGLFNTACVEFIASPKNKDAVAATQGYANLKRTCPSVFIDLFERNSKISKHR